MGWLQPLHTYRCQLSAVRGPEEPTSPHTGRPAQAWLYASCQRGPSPAFLWLDVQGCVHSSLFNHPCKSVQCRAAQEAVHLKGPQVLSQKEMLLIQWDWQLLGFHGAFRSPSFSGEGLNISKSYIHKALLKLFLKMWRPRKKTVFSPFSWLPIHSQKITFVFFLTV